MEEYQINTNLTRDQLETLLDLKQYTGVAAQFINGIINA